MSKTPMRPSRQTAKMPTKQHGPFGLLKTGDYTPPLALTLMVVALAAFVCMVVCRNKHQNLHLPTTQQIPKPPHRTTQRRPPTTTKTNRPFLEYRDRYYFPTQAQHAKSPACTVRTTPQNLGTRIGVRPINSKRGSVLLGGDLIPAPTHYSASSGSGSSSKRTSILSIRRPSITRAIIVIFVPS